MKFEKTVSTESKIPTSSMADIAFLLLVFFMATTIFRLEEGLTVTLPRAEMGERVPREKIAHVWIDGQGQVSVDDNLVRMQDLVFILNEKLKQNPAMIVGFNTEAQVEYKLMAQAIDAMKEAGVLPVSFTVKKQLQGQ
ncbi:MAG: biopolymer transporter ExbD [Candidatus Eiseniibacteriota bacterium]